MGISFVSAIALAWLGWRLLEQDRALEGQRTQERLDHASDRIVATLERKLGEIERLLDPDTQNPAPIEDVVRVRVSGDRLDAWPAGKLLYYPVRPPVPAIPRQAFAEGEVLEFQANDPTQALERYRRLAESTSPAIRGEALLRAGRVLRKQGRYPEALETLRRLAQLGDTPVAGLPAELLAREVECRVYEETGRKGELQRTARGILLDLYAAKWPLLRTDYEFHAQEARSWLAGHPEPPPEGHNSALAQAVSWLWEHGRQELGSEGRRLLPIEGGPVVILWRVSAGQITAVLAGERYLRSILQAAGEGLDVGCALTDDTGRLLAGRLEGLTPPRIVRASAVTRLPFTLQVADPGLAGESRGAITRRRLLTAGALIVMALLGAGGYLVLRAMARELAVAQLQSDFVASVSHEFRSPLTSIRQLSELLARDRVPTEVQRRQVYEVLLREGERLHRLVEGVLNFGRMEAGAAKYNTVALDPAPFAREVVAEFQEQIAPRGYKIEFAAAGDLPAVRADGEALGLALWNLLDNAVKYSPDSKTVHVELERESEWLALRVRDQGLGISPAEQKEIFRKFVRGRNSVAAGVKGTGIGLAMVDHIVRAHGGKIRLDSEPGQGSTFSILLPAERNA